MDRRDFLKQVLFWSAGLSTAIPVFKIVPMEPEAKAEAVSSPLVVHAVGKDYYGLVAKALEPLGGMGKFIRPGARVVIKPNIAWDRKPEQAATTHPLVVKALVEAVLAAGAAKVLVFDRTCNEERRCYVNSGIKEALDAIDDRRLDFFHPDQRKFVPVESTCRLPSTMDSPG
ncbi:MAG: DUF362 domain-containing protein [Deltaproteobacteria bacterium]